MQERRAQSLSAVWGMYGHGQFRHVVGHVSEAVHVPDPGCADDEVSGVGTQTEIAVPSAEIFSVDAKRRLLNDVSRQRRTMLLKDGFIEKIFQKRILVRCHGSDEKRHETFLSGRKKESGMAMIPQPVRKRNRAERQDYRSAGMTCRGRIAADMRRQAVRKVRELSVHVAG